MTSLKLVQPETQEDLYIISLSSQSRDDEDQKNLYSHAYVTTKRGNKFCLNVMERKKLYYKDLVTELSAEKAKSLVENEGLISLLVKEARRNLERMEFEFPIHLEGFLMVYRSQHPIEL